MAGSDVNERFGRPFVQLDIATEPAIAPEPGEGAFDHPAPGLHHEAARAWGPPYHLDRHLVLLGRPRGPVALVSAIDEQVS